MTLQIPENLELAVVESIATYLPPLLPRGIQYVPKAGDVLRRALMRDYIEDDFSMTKHMDSPFTEAKGFQLHASYNERDFRWAEYDVLQHLQTFDATTLPRKTFKYWTCACLYPLPPLVIPNWVQDADGAWSEQGKCEANKGNWSFAILYFNETPFMDWQPPDLPASDLPPNHTYARELIWHTEERSGKREISDYWRNTQLPHDARVYAKRKASGVPLTAYQERVVEAKGWPYPRVGAGEQPNVASGDSGGDDGSAADPSGSGGPDIDRLIAHCQAAKGTQPLHNKAHHDRWTQVMGYIRDGLFAAAKEFAKPWAAKGWKPWVDLKAMLDD